MSHQHPKGLWVRVHDRESALYTVRGSGFPFFLIGFLGLIAALMIAGSDTALRAGAITLASLGVMGLGYALRAGIGHPALIPAIWALFAGLLALEWSVVSSALMLAQGIVAMMAASGLRGWLWLRRR